jgi:cytochrome bd-type quinol oxidase subunit 1
LLIAGCLALHYKFGCKGAGLVTDAQFNGVFGQSMWIIVGSITARFLVLECMFSFFKKKQEIK